MDVALSWPIYNREITPQGWQALQRVIRLGRAGNQAGRAGHGMVFDPGTRSCLASAVLRPNTQIMSSPAKWVREERKP